MFFMLEGIVLRTLVTQFDVVLLKRESVKQA